MGIISEAVTAPAQLAATLAAGVNGLSGNQIVTFQQYTKSTLPIDGYVFWVNSGISIQYQGSLHQITNQVQEEDQTIAINRIVFTSLQEITEFNSISPTILWVGTWVADNINLRVVFNEQASFYQQAGLWHYSGDAVYPALESQLIDSSSDLPIEPIVSNSLPIWLSQNSFAPVYPSFLVPLNIEPPYVVAHIEPDETAVLGAFMIYQWPATSNLPPALNQMSSSQLMRDRVRLTLYGFTNQMAIQYLSSLMQYSINTDAFGFCNSPAIHDEKRIQAEIAVIAMKKTITILASYYQSTADTIAKRMIVSAGITSTIGA